MSAVVLAACKREAAKIINITETFDKFSPTAQFSATPDPTPTPSETPLSETPAPEPEPITGIEIEKQICADRIPVIELHYPGYHDGGVVQTSEATAAQLNYLKLSGYETINDIKLSQFLNGEVLPQAKTVMLRIDMGSGAHFDEYRGLINQLKENNQSAVLYILGDGGLTLSQENEIAGWVKEGLISVGSHSMTHPRFSAISADRALWEARNSKSNLEALFSRHNLNLRVISFAFPYDDVPQNTDFLNSSGYLFGLGGSLYRPKQNYARVGEMVVPSLYPYMTAELLEIIKVNEVNNPLAINLISGLTFDQLIYFNTTPFDLNKIRLVAGENYNRILFGADMPLPADNYYLQNLVRPLGIIIHTDDQPGNESDRWLSSRTYYGLLGRGINTTLAVGLDGVTQFVDMYPHFMVPNLGTMGFSNYIGIEMCGRDYNDLFARNTSDAKKSVIREISGRTVDLILKLIKQYNINPNQVYGHYEAAASGKTDPGREFMENYFRPLLRSKL